MEFDKTDEEGEVLHAWINRKVVRISEKLVVKKRTTEVVSLESYEVSNLRFVAASTTIPVPKVHDVRWEDGKVAGIVMDYMPGTPLDKVWKTLSSDEKQSIIEDLRGYVSQLQNLKGSPYIGAIDGGVVNIGNLDTRGGPCDSEKMFNEWILSDLIADFPAVLRHYAEGSLFNDHEIVFTHGDLHRRNILVDNGQITAILDWEFAGWYPEWWEYWASYRTISPTSDW